MTRDMHILRQLSEAPKELRGRLNQQPRRRGIFYRHHCPRSHPHHPRPHPGATPRLESSSSSSSSSSPPPPPPSVSSATPVASRGSTAVANVGHQAVGQGSSAPQDLSLRSGAAFQRPPGQAGRTWETLRWTVTLLVASTGSPTGFSVECTSTRWHETERRDPVCESRECSPFPSTTWHRSVIPAGH